MAYKTVALAGATGNLGPSILNALLAKNFTVTVLSRTTNHELPSGVKVAQVDYSSKDSLISALKGQDALVCALPDHGTQPFLIDAAIAAGVKHFIPSEFGCDVWGNEKTRALPVLAGKKLTQEYLRTKEGEISYTVIVTGAFLDWGIEKEFVVNLKGTTQLYDGGDKVRSMTTLQDIATAVVGVLSNPETTKNRAIYVQSAAVSQKQLLDLAKRVKPGFEAKVEDVDTADLEKEGYEELKKTHPDPIKAFVGHIKVGIFRDGFGGLWKKDDNELVGIKQMDERGLSEVVAKYV